MVAPVGPALTRACERPSATSAAARTIEALSRERTAATGSSSLVTASGASTSSMPGVPSRRESSAASPNTRSAIPSRAASRAPSVRAPAPRSAPRPSSAITGAEPGPISLLLFGRRRLGLGPGLSLGDLVRDHLATRVRAANGTDAVREPWAVAPRALVESRSGDLVRGAALVTAGARGSLLRDGHGERAIVAGTTPSEARKALRTVRRARPGARARRG